MSLRAGAAEIDITPAMGTHLGGDAVRLRPADKVLDPLFARALVVESGDGDNGNRLCLLTLDLCTPGNEVSEMIRRQVAERFGFARHAVMFHLLQNHSAPSLGTHLLLHEDSEGVRPDFWWVYKGDQRYLDALLPKIMAVVEQAVAKVEPVTMACGGMVDGRGTANRRFIMRDGWVQTHAGDRSQILQAEGPIDAEVGVACFRNAAGEVTATVLHYTAHPVSHFNTNWVTASWPGAWAQQFRAVAGDRCIPLVVNGCCGNIHSHDHLLPAPQTDHVVMGGWLTETAGQVFERLVWQDADEVAAMHETFDIPFGDMVAQLGQHAVDRARRILRDEPEPRWQDDEHTRLDIEWLFALATVELSKLKARGAYRYEVQTFRIGELGLVGLIGEPFVEGQLAIKLQSPFTRTFVAHMCNGWVGYIPPVSSYHGRNYNYRTPDGEPVRRGANLFLLAPEALDRITASSVRQLQRLKS